MSGLKVMATCKEISTLVSQSLDRRLTWRERLAIRLHLYVCDACRNFAGHLRWLRAALSLPQREEMMQNEVGLPPEARERIGRSLRDKP
jgi:predicted anti-sigma-YlaC factor YlaD